MDAKPQRPARSLKIYDENAQPSAHSAMQKTIHQRNKSSPALSTMAQAGALKAAARRTAFGDLSNTANVLRSSRDDSAIGAKGSHKLKENPPPIPEKKRTTFQKPAQRPMSVIGLRNLVDNAASAQFIVKEPMVVSRQPAANLAPIARRISTKRSTAVFKDSATWERSLPDQTAPEATAISASAAPVAPINRALPSLPSPHRSESRNDSREKYMDAVEKQEEPVTLLHSSQEAPENVPLPSNEIYADQVEDGHAHRTIKQAERQVEAAKPLESASTVITNHFVSRVSLTDHDVISHASGNAYLGHARRHKLPPVSEPEEYWEEEEAIENYDDDGYVTARSFKSRGENTTGGATTILFPKQTQKTRNEAALAKELIEGSKTVEELEDEAWDTTMVAEYSDEIFQYMRDLEIKMLPNAHYMDNQAEIQWSMRAVLMDWIVQVHHRFNLLPETLFLTINYIDRFLSAKIVSLGKLQLVGATAIFIASKYEEIDYPSVHEIAFMVDGGYTVDEILKAERFMLTMLQFELGWPGPMSFLRRISKADDYDLETRTLAKYFLEITIMDERFIGSPPSFVAAGAHCLARMMLRKSNWSPAHIYYSNYTYSQLYDLILLMFECCEDPRRHHAAIFEKYMDKRYKRASTFAESERRRGFQPLPVTTSFPVGNQALLSYAYDL